MEQQCGAWQVDGDAAEGRASFRVYFPPGADPHIDSIRVAGDFQSRIGASDWDVATGLRMGVRDGPGGGVFWEAVTPEALPAGFYQYKYVVDFEGGSRHWVTDPCARYGGLSDQNSGLAVGGSSPGENRVRPLPAGRLPLVDLNVYELMIDDFTAGYRGSRAPLDAVADRLDEIAALGFNAILFMPWTAWKNAEFDWGYEPFQFFSVEARYARDPVLPQEKISWLKRLVSACHDRGIHVVMDGVFNHVSVEFPYRQLYRNPADCPFTAKDFGGRFAGLQDLDFGNECTNQLVLDVCRYWVDEFGVDGIRFDNTVNYLVPGEVRGLPELLSRLQDHVSASGQVNFSMTLEHLDRSAARVTNQTAATSFWDNSLYEQFREAMRSGAVGPGLLHALNNRRELAEGKVPTLYLSNHDHSQAAFLSGTGGLTDSPGAVHGWWRVQPFLVALFTSTAVPMSPNGQEHGADHFVPEDDHGTGRRVRSRPVDWKAGEDPIGRTLAALHRRLATMRRDRPALRSREMYPDRWEAWQTQPTPSGLGFDAASQTVVYYRWAVLEDAVENVVVVLNFSDTERQVEVSFPTAGEWQDLLAGFDGGSAWSVVAGAARTSVPVGAHWGRVMWRLNT